MFQGGFEVVGDFLGNHVWRGEVGAFFKRVVFQPEDVEVRLPSSSNVWR